MTVNKGITVALVTVGVMIGMMISAVQYPGTGSPNAVAEIKTGSAVTYPPKLQNLSGNTSHFAIEPGSDTLWFPSINPDGGNKLFQYDPKTETLKQWSLPSDPGGGLFVGMGFGRGNQLWIAWDQTLVQFDVSSQELKRYEIPKESPYAVEGVVGSWVRDLAVTADGTVWLSRNHSTSLLAFEPGTATFTEQHLEGFGVPDRIRLSQNGRLWLTLARDPATQKEFTQIAAFDPLTRKLSVLPEQASSIAFDAQGKALLAGNPKGLTKIDPAGNVADRLPLPHPASVADLTITSPDGKHIVTDRVKSSVEVYDPAGNQWAIYKLETKAGQVIAPPGYNGPTVLEGVAEITDLHIDSSGNLWVLIPGYSRFAKIQL